MEGVPERSEGVKPGDTVEGRYRVVKLLDDGGMGTVYLAEHVLIKRKVALKILHPELANEANAVDQFMNEARAAGTLGHPNIVESTDMGFTRAGVPFIVYEYLEGALLTDEIYRTGGMAPKRALRIAWQIASALEAAHAAGVIHRDLKADNVFLTDRDGGADHVKVLDFGVSRFLDADHESTTLRSIIVGTPEYMAPEQISTPEVIDGRADVWSLGVLIYEMVTARRPYSAQVDPANLLERIVHDPPPPMGISDLPPGLEEMVCGRMLAKAPADRYQSMTDVKLMLEAFVGMMPRGRASLPSVFDATATIPAVTDGTIAAAAARAAPSMAPALRAPRRRAWGWLAAALVVGAASAGVWFSGRPAAAGPGRDPGGEALAADARAVAELIDGQIVAAMLRAEGIAATPVLRAAIETDAATVRDMAGSDFLIATKPGETVELFQLDAGTLSSMLRLPPQASPLTPPPGGQVRLDPAASGLVVVASADVTRQGAGVGGALTLSVPIDLAGLRARFADRGDGATLRGLAQPVVLAAPGTTPPATAEVEAALPAGPEARRPAGLSLHLAAAMPAPVVRRNARQVPALAGGGLAGLLLVVFALRLHRGRRQR